jgi:hypothetical protein
VYEDTNTGERYQLVVRPMWGGWRWVMITMQMETKPFMNKV